MALTLASSMTSIQHSDQDHGRVQRLLAEFEVHPVIISALIQRVRLLVINLISQDVQEETITCVQGIISNRVVQAFHQVGGDFGDAVPYCLLEARKQFVRDSKNSTIDNVLHHRRALATEVIARRLVTHLERVSIQQQQAAPVNHLSLTKKFRRIQNDDGDISIPTSALESAIDQNSILLLSSKESQTAVQAIWQGQLVQKFGQDGYTYFQPYRYLDDGSFLAHFHPSRLAVPKYSYILNLASWMIFIALFTVQTRTYKSLDIWEALLWVMVAGYLVQDVSRWFKMGGLDTISFWTVLDVATNSLFFTSFCFRVASFTARSSHASRLYELNAFQILACVAPLVWIQLLKLFDGFKYWGTIQVIILRMIKETAVFFTLLLLVMVGFFHAFYALDAADESRVDNAAIKIADTLAQTLLGGANFDLTNDQAFSYPYGHILYYAYCFVTAVILLNVLIAFFGTAYSEVVDAADQVYCACFSEKVISMVRAPDQYVYLPPFNMIEAFFIAPLEWVLPRSTYSAINYWIQSTLFCLPMFAIAWYESRNARNGGNGAIALSSDSHQQQDLHTSGIQGTIQDPIIPQEIESKGMQISNTKFENILLQMGSNG